MEPKFVVYEGTALGHIAFRIVGRNPPTEDDFRSYAAMGRNVPERDFFRATGVSMYRSLAAAERANARYKLGGTHYAEVDIGDSTILFAETGGSEHITVWAPPSLFLQRVRNVVGG